MGEPEVIVQLLEEPLKRDQWTKGSVNRPEPSHVGPCASIEDISRAFGLNKKQHVCLQIAGRALLKSFVGAVKGTNPAPALRMHIAGEEGTGKSRVIHAIRQLASSWARSEAVKTVATTGKAASLIDGETVHSFLRINPNRNAEMESLKVSEGERIRFARLHMLIWDELSMASKELLAKAFRNLNILADTSPQNECRVHIITLGDFFQLSPVKANYLFESAFHRHQSQRKYTGDT